MPTEMPDTGGEDQPVGQYAVLSAGPAVELKGVTDSQDVEEVIVQAKPSNVIFTLRFLPEAYNPQTVGALSGSFAGYFNDMMKLPGVSGVSTYQDVNDSDTIEDIMRIVVRSTSGKSSFPIEETQFGRRLDYLAPEIAAKVAELDAIEKGH